MDWIAKLPFRLGTTSYILPDDILPNVRFLAGKVRDVELVLFDVDETQNNLPSGEVVDALQEAAKHHDLSYTMHLPLDLRLGGDGDERHHSLLKAERTIAATRQLAPQAYIAHLDMQEVRLSADSEALRRWRQQARGALEMVAAIAGSTEMLAVENLEHYPQDFWEPVLENLPVSRCVDVGHLWLDEIDPLPYLDRALPRTRVIHLHGVDQRDHASLACVPDEKLDAVMQFLLRRRFSGIVTMEVFNKADFLSSWMAVKTSLGRIQHSHNLPQAGNLRED